MTRGALIVGAGLALAPHVRALRAHGVEVAAIVTSDPQRAERARSLAGQARICATVDEGLRCAADLAVVCTPPAAHLGVVSQLSRAGLDLVVEKPLAESMQSAAACVRHAAAAGVRLAVVFQHRYKPAAVAAQRLLDAGVIGELVGATLTVPWWRPQHYYAGGERGSRARDGGGVLITQAIHALDLYQHLVGPVRAVSAHTGRTAVHEMECEDVVHAILQHDGPNAASLFATTAARAAQPEAIELYGTESTLRLVGSTLSLHRSGSTTSVVSEDVPTTAAEASAAVEWFVGLYRDVLRSWERGRDPGCNAASALQTQRLVEATYRAVREHRWVPVAHDDYPDVSDRGLEEKPCR